MHFILVSMQMKMKICISNLCIVFREQWFQHENLHIKFVLSYLGSGNFNCYSIVQKDFSKCDINDQLSLYGDVENQCMLQANVFL
jgi:hypothetical protein